MDRRKRIEYLQKRIDINTEKAMKLYKINERHNAEIDKHMRKLHHKK